MQKTIVINSTRNYGIDLYKMFAMFLVVVLHVLGQGGVLNSCEQFSTNYNIAWCLEMIAYCAVNCFALASGYVMVDSKFKLHKILNLWITVVFYSVVLPLLFFIIFKDNNLLLYLKTAFFPLSKNSYWYFSAYFITFLFIPFFNFILNNMHKKELTYLIWVSIILFSVFPAILSKDILFTLHGYSYIWISILYLVGGYLKKFNIGQHISTIKLWIITFLSIILTCGGKLLTDFYSFNTSKSNVTEDLIIVSDDYGRYLNGNTFLNYTFPTILLTAIMLLLLFTRIQVKSGFLKNKISSFIPLIFSIYIIHTTAVIWDNMLFGLFESFAIYNPFIMVLCILGVSLAIYLICIMLDMLRFELFRVLKINYLCEKLVNFVSVKASKFFPDTIIVKDKNTIN